MKVMQVAIKKTEKANTSFATFLRYLPDSNIQTIKSGIISTESYLFIPLQKSCNSTAVRLNSSVSGSLQHTS
jgi:hypothetical protein